MGSRRKSADPRPISLLTDFGTQDAWVGIMKGVIARIAPRAPVIDITHEIPPQAILPAALLLRNAAPFFPAGTVHVVVVDPGVGTRRRALVIETRQALLVGPDNGVLWPAAERLGLVRIRSAENDRLFLHPVSRTFHGRDVFAPVAAHLAAGLPPSEVGPQVAEMERMEIPRPRVNPDGSVTGQVLHVDRFGNLITNVDGKLLASLAPERLRVSIGPVRDLPLVSAYAGVAEGRLLAIVGSSDLLEVAARNASAAAILGIGPGAEVTVGKVRPRTPAAQGRRSRR